jgi:hypothetical protein
VLTEYLRHYNAARPHRALGQLTPAQAAPSHLNRSTSPTTGSAGNKSSVGSPTSTTSLPYNPTLLRKGAGHPPESYFRAPQGRSAENPSWAARSTSTRTPPDARKTRRSTTESYFRAGQVWPLPPAGPLEFICQWPVYGIGETRVGIDGQVILDAARRSVQLWPEDG